MQCISVQEDAVHAKLQLLAAPLLRLLPLAGRASHEVSIVYPFWHRRILEPVARTQAEAPTLQPCILQDLNARPSGRELQSLCKDTRRERRSWAQIQQLYSRCESAFCGSHTSAATSEPFVASRHPSGGAASRSACPDPRPVSPITGIDELLAHSMRASSLSGIGR